MSTIWCWFCVELNEIRKTRPGPISRTIFHRNSNSMGNWFYCNFIAGYDIATKFFTCHDSTAVVPCTKFHSDHFIITWMRPENNFHRIWIPMENRYCVADLPQNAHNGCLVSHPWRQDVWGVFCKLKSDQWSNLLPLMCCVLYCDILGHVIRRPVCIHMTRDKKVVYIDQVTM